MPKEEDRTMTTETRQLVDLLKRLVEANDNKLLSPQHRAWDDARALLRRIES